MNDKHYHGEQCKKCRKTLRYLTSRNCVACAKLAVKLRRTAKAAAELDNDPLLR